MREILRDKFTRNVALRQALCHTDELLLEEGNNWNDKFWGICPPMTGNGLNHLGKLLMEIRSELCQG
jgi:predicted NAD-dependent protein-ADP-ribosyltransferase YbiA (DUF1768 family)